MLLIPLIIGCVAIRNKLCKWCRKKTSSETDQPVTISKRVVMDQGRMSVSAPKLKPITAGSIKKLPEFYYLTFYVYVVTPVV